MYMYHINKGLLAINMLKGKIELKSQMFDLKITY